LYRRILGRVAPAAKGNDPIAARTKMHITAAEAVPSNINKNRLQRLPQLRHQL
jgi:hypothetical protein